MNYLLRFYLYDNPSRQRFYQLGTDQWAQKRPQFIYGLPYRFDPEEFGSMGDPNQVYVIANPIFVKPQCPAQPVGSRFMINVFLARLEEWGWFDEAPEVKQSDQSKQGQLKGLRKKSISSTLESTGYHSLKTPLLTTTN